MNQERRRYFRINETVGIAYQTIDVNGHDGLGGKVPDVMQLVAKQDRKIERLLREVADEHPKIAELVSVFNQKLERIVNHIVLESDLVERIAQRIKEANLSACGMAFSNDEAVEVGARLKLELTLYPSEYKLSTAGIVVACDKQSDSSEWYWRIDFFDMADHAQEALIQHIVKSQSQQIKNFRG